MSTEREKTAELENYLKGQKNTPSIKKLVEYLTKVRGKCLDNLEKKNDDELRGKSKFCKELLRLLSE